MQTRVKKWLLTCQIVKESSACYENYGETLGSGGQDLQVTGWLRFCCGGYGLALAAKNGLYLILFYKNTNRNQGMAEIVTTKS